MKRFIFLSIIALGFVFLSSCEENNTPEPQTAPEIPPMEILSIPTAVLSETQTDTTNHLNGATYRNWIYSGVNLLVWNTAIVLNTSVPVAAFGRALNERPVYIGNGTFQWSYQYQAPLALGGHSYGVVLTGRFVNNNQDVEWVMNLSQVGGFSNFEWYSGIVSVDHTEAIWTVNHKPNNPEPYMSIDYEGNATNDDGTIRFTNINPSSNDIGGYIEYRVDSTNPFNRAFDINGGPNNPGEFIEIQWVEPTMEGRVKSPGHYGDTNWHCWNTDQQDTGC